MLDPYQQDKTSSQVNIVPGFWKPIVLHLRRWPIPARKVRSRESVEGVAAIVTRHFDIINFSNHE